MANYVSYYLKVDAPMQVVGGMGGEGMAQLERKSLCVWNEKVIYKEFLEVKYFRLGGYSL